VAAAKGLRYHRQVTVQDQFRVDVRRDSGRIVFSLFGELDLASAPILQGALEDVDVGPSTTVVFDLQGLEFIDSTGLRTIFSAQERLRALDGEFAVTRGSPQVQRLLEITRADEHLQVLGSPDEAFA
jgi:anti-sigma B factor antagonist